MQEVEDQIGAGASPMVQTILQSNDSDSLPERGLGINPAKSSSHLAVMPLMWILSIW